MAVVGSRPVHYEYGMILPTTTVHNGLVVEVIDLTSPPARRWWDPQYDERTGGEARKLSTICTYYSALPPPLSIPWSITTTRTSYQKQKDQYQTSIDQSEHD